jgi:hypothetical protein
VALPREPSGAADQAHEMVGVSSTGGRKAIFLDRDGVIVVPEFRDGRSFAPRSLEDYRFYPQAPAALSRLKSAGYLLIVVTSQPEVGRGQRFLQKCIAGFWRRFPSMLSRFADIQRHTSAIAASRKPECCSNRRANSGYRCRAATWSETGQATSKPGARPDVGRFLSTWATQASQSRIRLPSRCPRSYMLLTRCWPLRPTKMDQRDAAYTRSQDQDFR